MIILIGESGSGKTTILKELEKRGYQKPINYTTREKRQEEKEDQEYEFVTKEQFERLWQKNQLVQRAEFNGQFYGMDRQSLKNNVACISIVDSVSDIRKKIEQDNLQNISLHVFYLYVPTEERIQRMLKRGDSIDFIQKRMAIDKEKFQKVEEVMDYKIENNNFQQALEKIIQIDKS